MELSVTGDILTIKAETGFDHGLLTPTIPKAKEARAKTIPVRSNQQIDGKNA